MKIAQKLPAPTPISSTTVRRLQRLEWLAAKGQEATVRGALGEVWAEGRSPEIRLRESLIRLRAPVEGDVSDGKVRQLPQRPPAAKLVSPRGLALRLYLVALFYAQCTTKAGRKPVNALPLEPSEPGVRSWSDLVAAHATSNPANARRLVGIRENRVRQLKHALGRLARNDVRLVELPHAGRATGKYEGFRLLDESGSGGHAMPLPYSVPLGNKAVFTISPAFFLQGWVHVLEDREIAAYLLLCQRTAIAGIMTLSADERLRCYGLARTTYEALATLERFGLVESIPDPDRRADGTFDGYSEGATPKPNQYKLTDGVERVAIDTVVAALGR